MLIKSLIKIFKILPKKRRYQFLILLCLMIFGVLAEISTLGAVIPFLTIIIGGEKFEGIEKFQFILNIIGHDENKLAKALILFVGVVIISALLKTLLIWSSLRFAHAVGADLSAKLYAKTLYRTYKWHVSKNSSEILAGIEKITVVVNGLLTPFVVGGVAFVMTAGIILMLFFINTGAAIIVCSVFGSAYLLTSMLLRNKLNNNSALIARNVTKRMKVVQEGLGGIREILLNGSHSIYIDNFIKYDRAVRKALATNGLIAATPRYIIESLGMILIVIAAYLVSDGGKNDILNAIPIMGAILIGAQKLLPQMQLLYGSISTMVGNLHAAIDVYNIISDTSGSHTKVGHRNISNGFIPDPIEFKSEIELTNVSFKYTEKSKLIIDDVSLKIKKGSIIGIVGKTGSGKTTLVDIIVGLLEPTHGCIKIDGVCINGENIRGWQRRIAHVSQAIYLSDATIVENIAFGVEPDKIDFSKVQAAAQKAMLSDFIEGTERGYRSLVGERGVRLSGGQIQRLGIARALYKQADILVLDEATSALDTETERDVINSIHAVDEEITIIMIAHRMNTLSICDEIISIEEGNIMFKNYHQLQ
jgi:ABC-type multidrug transport system fused ATPase/permease subunit